MSNALYANYQRRVFELAKTLIVKHSEVADAINKGLAERGYVIDVNQPQTWKYYMNLAGDYHPADEVALARLQGAGNNRLTIKKAGATGPVDVVFDKNLLQEDPILANEYRYGTRFYNDLVRRYPDFEELILGILNPIPYDVSIAAKDGDILHCGGYFRRHVISESGEKRIAFTLRGVDGRVDPDLIEENETVVIYELEEWIKGFLIRWHNPDYAKVDDLYVPSMLGMLYVNIPKVVMNIRLKYCKSPMAHSYHIREYLESHGRLAKYISVLSKKQALYLYRNIEYIEVNVGREETFDDLVQNLLTESGIPLAGYDIRHNLANQPQNLLPEAKLVRETINFRQVGVGNDVRSVGSILLREAPLGREGDRDLPQVEAEITEQMVTSLSNELPTKVLESAMIDYADSIPFPLSEWLLNNWIYYSCHGLYTGVVYVTHPLTGERLQMTAKTAFILAIYCFNKGYANITLTHVPAIQARLIERQINPLRAGLPVRPTLSDLQDFVTSDVVSAQMLQHLMGMYKPEKSYTASDDFYNDVVVLHRDLMRRYYFYASQDNAIARSQLEIAAYELYWGEVTCDFADGQTITYADWLMDNGIDLTGLASADFVLLATELVKAGTGAGENANKSLRELQTAMLAIMRQLSSYSVQYLQSINNQAAMVVDPKSVRPSNDRTTWHISERVGRIPVSALEIDALAKDRQSMGLFGDAVVSLPDARFHGKATIDTSLTTKHKQRPRMTLRVSLPSVRAIDLVSTDVALEALLANIVVDGFQYPPQ